MLDTVHCEVVGGNWAAGNLVNVWSVCSQNGDLVQHQQKKLQSVLQQTKTMNNENIFPFG